jgi:hypothetical protein
MSKFVVVATALTEHAARLRGFSGEIETARGCVARGATAAADTPAAGAVEHLTGHVHGRLADFAAAADALHSAVTGAGDAYARADASVEESAR